MSLICTASVLMLLAALTDNSDRAADNSRVRRLELALQSPADPDDELQNRPRGHQLPDLIERTKRLLEN